MSNKSLEMLSELIREIRFSDLGVQKNIPIKLSDRDFERHPGEEYALSDELFDLVSTAYADLGGHLKIQTSKDIPGDYDQNYAMDLDHDPEPDIYRAAKSTQHGTKLAAAGHDGKSRSKKASVSLTAEMLRDSGGYAEMSGPIAHIMITRYSIPAVTDYDSVYKILDKDIEWLGPHPDPARQKRYGDNYKGWYYRSIGGKKVAKILLGNPLSENTLKEAAKKPQDLHDQGSIIASIDGKDITVILNLHHDDPDEPVGIVRAIQNVSRYGHCAGAYIVILSDAPRGWGPLLYDIVMELAGEDGLMADRESVSSDAYHVWNYYMANRPDVENILLDDIDIVGDDQSNACSQETAEADMGDNWENSPLSRVYYKANTSLLDFLMKEDLLTLYINDVRYEE